jgi:hypothetical protein
MAVPVSVQRSTSVHQVLEATQQAGSLVVHSEPAGAEVWVDGEYRAKTPGLITGVPVGTCNLKIEMPGYAPEHRSVEVTNDTAVRVSAKLISRKAAYYREAITREPDTVSHYTELGRLLALEGDVQSGFDLLSEALRVVQRSKSPAEKGFYELLRTLELAEPDMETPRWRRFDEELLAAARRPPQDMLIPRLVQGLLEERHRWKAILGLCADLLAAGRKDTEVYLWRFAAAQRLKEHELAKQDLGILIQLVQNGPQRFSAYQAVVLALANIEQWQSVRELCDFALAKGNEEVDFYFWRMNAASILKDWNQAILDFQVLDRHLAKAESSPATRFAFEHIRQAALFTGALACLELGQNERFQQILRRYPFHPMSDYWVEAVRGEQWLRKRAGPPPKPCLDATPCNEPPTIDGKLDEPVWQAAKGGTEFYHWLSDERRAIPTTVKAAYDGACLYVAVRCEDQGREHIHAEAKDEDVNGLISDTRLELFIDANRDYRTYIQFMLNPIGSRADLDCRKAIRFVSRPPFGHRIIDPEWNSDFRAGVQVGDEEWTAEMAFPYRILDAQPPRPGDAWGFNLVRCGTGKGREDVSFTPVYGDYHQPERNALLLFQAE